MVLRVGGTGFTPAYNYACRFSCAAAICRQAALGTSAPEYVSSVANVISQSALECKVPVWPLPAAKTTVTIWRGDIRITLNTSIRGADFNDFQYRGAAMNFSIMISNLAASIDACLAQRAG